MITKRSTTYLQTTRAWIFWLLLLSGCSISLISRYDEVIDKGITDFQRKVDLYLLQKTRNPSSAYDTAFYNGVYVDLQILKTRATSVPKNEQTSGLIDILLKHVKNIEATDKKGTSTASTYEILQESIDQTCGNLLTLELAKRRKNNMALDVEQIANQMLGAALPILTQGGAKVGDYASTEFKKIAERIKVIGEKVIIGEIHAEDAPMLLQVQTDVATGVLATASGLGEIVVQNAINAALGVVKGVVNGALDFGLIV